jgi:inner membrane protein
MTDTASVPGPQSRGFGLPRWLSSPLLRKGLFLFVLILLFLLPLQLVRELVGERAWRQYEVEQEIGQLWGPNQIVSGPLIVLPVAEASGQRGQLFLLPETLTVDGTLAPEARKRGLFEALVYQADLKVTASFRIPKPETLGLQDRQPQWQEARLLVRATELAGLSGSVPVALGPSNGLGGGDTQLKPATLVKEAGALEAPLAGLKPGDSLSLAFRLTLNGSRSFQIVPVGETSEIRLASTWPHPSFGGAGLPTESEITAGGFTAQWQASAFAEGLPTAWVVKAHQLATDSLQQLDYAALGVSLIQPVDAHVMSERAVKYALFVLALVFAAVFLFEIAGGRPLHPVQYLLVGAAETLFYLLLLSLSEAIGFDPAYWLASAATILLIAFYLAVSLGSWKRGAALGLGLTAVKTYLYVTLASEDFALLSGSLALFLLLAALMLATRKVDWYRLSAKRI